MGRTRAEVREDLGKGGCYDGVLVYVSELRPRRLRFQARHREHADALRAAGLHVVSCYQYGKPG
jgi:hypothetical protein